MDYSSTNNNSSSINNNSSHQQPPLHAQPPPPVVLTPALLGSLKVSKIFKDNTQIITSLDFDDTGAKCVTSAQDESLHVYDCVTGKLDKTLFSKKYGVHLARFTHRSTNVVYASTKEDDTLRYLSLHDNKYIRYFRGHEKKVTALEMSPLDDQFLAGSEEAVRLWDLRSPNCQGALAVEGRPAIAFDPSGLVFAVALGCTLRLYDVKVFDQGPFDSANIGQSLPLPLNYSTSIYATQLEFSSDGKNILVTTASDAHYVVDAFKPANTRFRLIGHYYNYTGNDVFQSGGEACWTPDGKFVVSGSRDGSIYVWDIAKAMADQAAGIFGGAGSNGSNGGINGSVSGVPGGGGAGGNGQSGGLLSANGELRPFKVLKAHGTPSHIVAFNPKYLMMVSGSTELAFWEPDPNSVGMDALHDFSKGGRH
ncbi:member of Set1p complex, histone methyl transferase [Entomortierella chlamydospora]|uniref:Member of Set1p complex, histone methyl transferase n=1 Tax=Entomortierella chlamydospora TaxID=101097 RepID=A0A9P6T012_9FUNG|nr:member of Set1p complex, histone methyl transferase [Entomortierella chlamydospora]KAG0014507.1 member of Set1p complex, histone methyl transferase [Entomortierella chlamydospora]